jgi:hypothetical protein
MYFVDKRRRKIMLKVTADLRVLDFVRGINQLSKDTEIEVKGSGLGKAILETPEGDGYYLTLDNNSGTYIPVPFKKGVNDVKR